MQIMSLVLVIVLAAKCKAIHYTSLDVCSGDKGELKTPSNAAHVSSNCWREIQPARLRMTLKSRKRTDLTDNILHLVV